MILIMHKPDYIPEFGKTKVYYKEIEYTILGCMESDDEYFARNVIGESINFYKTDMIIINNKIILSGDSVIEYQIIKENRNGCCN